MSDVTVTSAGEIGYYQGPKAIPGIKFRHAARDLGVSAWGMGVIDMDPGVTGYPEHDHVESGQEEVYVVLKGSATLRAAGREWALAEGAIVRVPPDVKRAFLPGASGVTLLAIGGTPGKAYAAAK